MKKVFLRLALFTASLPFLHSCAKDESPGPVRYVKLKAHVKQLGDDVKDAVVKLTYVGNGREYKDSVITGANGIAELDAYPLVAGKITITSHCGVLLYERQFGPYAQDQVVDTTYDVVANTLACELTPPEEFVSYLVNGVNHRLVFPGDDALFTRISATEVRYKLSRADGSDEAIVDCLIEQPKLGSMMYLGKVPVFSAAPGSVVYDEREETEAFMSGTFIMDLSTVKPPALDALSGYKIDGKFRLKVRPKTEAANWEDFE